MTAEAHVITTWDDASQSPHSPESAQLIVSMSQDPIEAETQVTVSLDGVTLASGGLPSFCSSKSQNNTSMPVKQSASGNNKGTNFVVASAPATSPAPFVYNNESVKLGAHYLPDVEPLKGSNTGTVATVSSPTDRATTLLLKNSKEECQNTKNKVDIHQAGFPTHSVLGPDNIVISGDSIHNRVCTLKGVVKFTYIDGSVQAQMDPNLRNPLTMTPLCFPMATMTFFAGVASNASSPIQSNVIVQVEPHGRIRIVVPKMFEGVIVRLDGITYAPLMEFNVPPSQCGNCHTPCALLQSPYYCHHEYDTLLGSSVLLPTRKRRW